MEQVSLTVQRREEAGKKSTKQIRKAGNIPAVVYGFKTKTVSISVDAKAFLTATHTGAGENAVISLNIEGGAKKQQENVLVKAVQHDPITDAVKHVDFQAISLTEKITAEVPIHEKGEAAGIIEGGVLDHVHRTLKVECLPTQIPESIEVLIDELNINDSLHVKDLILPEGAASLLDPEEVILKILPPTKEEEPAAEEEAEGEAAEPEVITAKKEEGEGEAAPEKPAEEKKES